MTTTITLYCSISLTEHNEDDAQKIIMKKKITTVDSRYLELAYLE